MHACSWQTKTKVAILCVQNHAANDSCPGGPSSPQRPRVDVSRRRRQWAICDHRSVEPIPPFSCLYLPPFLRLQPGDGATVVLWALAATVHGLGDVCDMPTSGTAVSRRLAMHRG